MDVAGKRHHESQLIAIRKKDGTVTTKPKTIQTVQ
jgi:hypothetical protein